MKTKSSRSAIPIHINREICNLQHLQPNLTHKEIANVINEKYSKKLADGFQSSFASKTSKCSSAS